MDLDNSSATNYDSTSASRSVFLCQKLPYLLWDLTHTTFPWILAVITFIVSPITAVLNVTGTVALKKRKELKKQIEHFAVQLGGHLYPDRSYNYATNCNNRYLNARPGFFRIFLYIRFPRKQTHDVFPIVIIFISIDNHCLVEIHDHKTWDGLQKQSNQKPPQKTCANYMAIGFFQTRLSCYSNGNKYFRKSPWYLAFSRGCYGPWLFNRYRMLLHQGLPGVRRRKKKTSQLPSMLYVKIESKIAKTTGSITAGLVFSFFVLHSWMP